MYSLVDNKNISLYRIWQMLVACGVSELMGLAVVVSLFISLTASSTYAASGALLPTGSLVKGPNTMAVYFIDGNTKRVFPDAKTYLTWYPDFSGIQTVSIETLDRYTTVEPVYYRPGIKLVTHPNTAKVYAVEPGGMLRWLPDEATAIKLYGPAWAKRVNDVHELTFGNYDIGQPATAQGYPEGSLLQPAGSQQIYYVDDSGLRLIGYSSDLAKNNFRPEDVISGIGISGYQIAQPITGYEVTLAEPVNLGADPGQSQVSPGGAQLTPPSPSPLPPSDITAPGISGVVVSGITSASATITWTTNEASDAQVEYGTTISYGSVTTLNTVMTTSHGSSLTGLSANTLYHYRVKSRDAAGNLATSGDFNFTTQAIADTAAPTISDVSVGSITTSGATVSWTTNEASDSQVDYGASTAYGSQVISVQDVISHSLNLSALGASTLHHYKVTSCDAAGNCAVSGDQTFTTLTPADTTAPVISNVSSNNISYSGATITWATNEASSAKVEYGLTTNYGFKDSVASLATSHSFTLSNLIDGDGYHYKVTSCDAAGNCAVSNDQIFTTAGSAGTAATYYVDPAQGTDAPTSGSLAQPYKTINYARSLLAQAGISGYTFYLRGGVYREKVRSWNSGNVGSRNVLRGYPGETAVISGADIKTDWADAGAGIYKRSMTDIWDNYRGVVEDNRSLIEARYPNEGSGFLSASSLNTTRLIDSDLAASGLSEADIEGSYVEAMGEQTTGLPVKVQDYDPATYTITYATPLSSASTLSYRLINGLGLLDVAGEYYYNFASGADELYIKTWGGDDPLNHQVEVVARDYGLYFGVDSLAAHYINIEDVEIRHTSYAGVMVDGRNSTSDFPSHLSFKNLYIHDISGNGFVVNWYSRFSHVALLNSTIEYTAGKGIEVHGPDTHNTYSNVYSYLNDNRVRWNRYSGVQLGQVAGIAVAGNTIEYNGAYSNASGVSLHYVSDVTVSGNTIRYTSGNGILTEGSGSARNHHIQILNNTITEPSWLNTCSQSWMKGIWISDTDDSVIKGNAVSSPKSNGAQLDGGDRNVMVYNTFSDLMDSCPTIGGYVFQLLDATGGDYLGYARDNIVAHNVFEGGYMAGWKIWASKRDRGDNITGNIVSNNIFQTSNASLAIMSVLDATVNHNLNTYDNNLYYSTGKPVTFSRGTATYQDTHAIVGDPRFVSVPGHNFALQAGSPGIDGGMDIDNVNEGYQGAGADIGAFEQ